MASISLNSIVPGLDVIRTYKREWLTSDLVAGLSVAAVAVPVGIAYAQLIGFPPVTGIYSSIFPLLAYALLGSSRQLIVNPDAAACAILASTVAPIAVRDPTHYVDLAIAVTLITGLLFIVGGMIGLGAIANFLSRPILTGYLNGIALSVIVGQIGKLLGFKLTSEGFIRPIIEAISRFGETNVTTAILGISLLVFLIVVKKISPTIPGPLIAAALGIAAVYFFGLQSQGVAVVGNIPAGFSAPRMPLVDQSELPQLLIGAGGIVLVSYCSMMTTARGFAAKNGYTVRANQDMVALGVCDLAAGLSQGFVVSAAASRTAVADSSGSKTQMTGIFAAVFISAVLVFLTGPLAFLPTTVLAAILISAVLGLFDFASLRRYYKLSKPEFRHAVIAMLGVITVGVLPGILVAVALALFKLLLHASHPNDALLGLTKSEDGYYSTSEDSNEQQIPGLVIYRFDSALVFFNADYFKARSLEAVDKDGQKPQWLLLNAESMPFLDVSGADAIESLRSELDRKGITLAIARPKGLFRLMLERSGVAERIREDRIFQTVHAGVQAFVLASRVDMSNGDVRNNTVQASIPSQNS